MIGTAASNLRMSLPRPTKARLDRRGSFSLVDCIAARYCLVSKTNFTRCNGELTGAKLDIFAEAKDSPSETSLLKMMGFLVRPSGFEPLAFCSGGRRSIQLSYGCTPVNRLLQSTKTRHSAPSTIIGIQEPPFPACRKPLQTAFRP